MSYKMQVGGTGYTKLDIVVLTDTGLTVGAELKVNSTTFNKHEVVKMLEKMRELVLEKNDPAA